MMIPSVSALAGMAPMTADALQVVGGGLPPAATLSAREVEFPRAAGLAVTPSVGVAPAATAPFDHVLGRLVSEVDAKLQTAEVEKKKVMLGESDNLHQAMLAVGEAGTAFSFLVEVRNKLVESYQEIMRMQV